MKRRSLLALAPASAVAQPAGRAAAQPAGWPDRPITLVSPFLAGGSTDIVARIIAERAAARMGGTTRIIVENRAGAGGSIGSEWVKNRAPDGYTWLLASASSHGTNPAALPAHTPYDPVADFSPIAILGDAPMVLAVPYNSRFRTAQELWAFARANPGALSWGTSGAGGIGHLTGEFMRVMAGDFRTEFIPYRGGSGVLEALAKSEVDYALEVLASSAPALRDNISRGLAVTSRARHPLFPDIPTMAECGLEGFEIATWNIIVGPRGMEAGLVRHINAQINGVLTDPVAAARLVTAGLDAIPGGSTPESTAAFIRAEVAKFRDIVARAGLRLGR